MSSEKTIIGNEEINFPTELHRTATNASKDFFLNQQHIDTILLVNSLARGKATPESDIDMAILVPVTTTIAERERLYSIWNEFLNSDPGLKQFRRSSKFAQIHLDIFDGVFEPAPWEDGGAIDSFELEIGNRILYSEPLNGMANILKIEIKMVAILRRRTPGGKITIGERIVPL
jgi:predicted nucleotidyltransferase